MNSKQNSSVSSVVDSSRNQRACDEFLARAQRRIQTSLAQAQAARKTLSKMEKLFAASKSGKEEDSIFTRENVRTMIGVVEKIFPEEVGLLEALKRMEPLTAKPFSELKNPSKTTNPVQPGATIQRLLPATKAIFDKMAPAQTAATPVPENATRSRKLITKVRRRSTI